MKRTVFHMQQKLLTQSSPAPFSANLFPFLNSKIVQTYSKSIIHFKKIHALANFSNIKNVVPLPSPCKEFIFFGRSNVGKSTLLNRLMQAPVAAVSKRPGKTKELLFCQVGSNKEADIKMINGKVYFVDAPGYGYATGVSKDQIKQWGKLITSYLKLTKSNSINQRILCLIDLDHDLKQTDAIIFQLLQSLQKNFILIFTKCDNFSSFSTPLSAPQPAYPLFNQPKIQKQKMNWQLKRGLELAQIIQEKYKTMNFYVHFTSSHTMLGIDQLRNHLMFDIVSDRI